MCNLPRQPALYDTGLWVISFSRRSQTSSKRCSASILNMEATTGRWPLRRSAGAQWPQWRRKVSGRSWPNVRVRHHARERPHTVIRLDVSHYRNASVSRPALYFFRLSRISRSRSTSSAGSAGSAAGSAGVSSCRSRLTCLIIIKMIKARIMKLTRIVMKLP